MRHYIAVVHKDEDSAYGAHFPDIPGCVSAADALDDLPASASEALALYLEDQEPPEPTPVERLREDPDVRAAIAEGAFLLAVPLVRLTGRTVKANLTMDAGLLQAIDAAAKARGMTRSAFIADAARRELVE